MTIAYLIVAPVAAFEALMLYAFQDSPRPMPGVGLYALFLLLLPAGSFAAGRVSRRRNHRRTSAVILWGGILFAVSPLLLTFVPPFARFALVIFHAAFN
jgi:hypothetical protein